MIVNLNLIPKKNQFFFFLINLLIFVYLFCWLKLKNIKDFIFENQNIILDHYKSNEFIVNKYFKKFKFLKKNNENLKILLLFKKKLNLYISKNLDFFDKRYFRKNFIFLKYKKKSYNILKKRKIKRRIIKRVSRYFKKILKKRSNNSNIFLKNRLFYYDFFFNKYEKNLYLLKKKK